MFTATDEREIWQHVQHARQDLYDYLVTLKPVDWNHASLCSGWSVRDVVAHMIVIYQYEPRNALGQFIRHGFRPNSFIKHTAKQYAERPTPELLSEYKKLINHQKLPFFVPPLNVLADTLIHEQDIRIPLGKSTAMPLSSLQLIFDHWQPGKANIGERITGIAKTTKGLRFQATDITAEYGHGLLVTGSAQDILLAICGRGTVFGRLSGPGSVVLSARVLSSS